MSETATDNGIYQSAFMVELLRQIKAHDQYGTHDGWSAERLLEPFFRKREQAAAGCTVDRAALLRVTTFYQALAVLIEGECGQMASLVVNINDEGFGRVLLIVGRLVVLDKTVRDAGMIELHAIYPQYAFDRHMGYPTAQHLAALRAFGATPEHRRSFAPVARLGRA